MKHNRLQTYFLHLFALVAMLCLAGQKTQALRLMTKKIDGKEYYYYKVQEGDDIYSVASKIGLTRNDIVKYNTSAADGLKYGMTLFFPVDEEGTGYTAKAAEAVETSPKPVVSPTTLTDTEDSGEIQPVESGDLRLRPVHPAIERRPAPDPHGIKVAVCLPFSLASEDNVPKAGVYATDFYRGFLLGIDSLRAQYGNPPIQITAIDTETAGALTADAQNARVLAQADIIIAPEAMNRLMELGKIGRDRQVYVFNVFQTKDSTYVNNPYMLQGTVPSADMYQKAINWFVESLDGAFPVFIDNEHGRKDKQGFVDQLRKTLENEHIPFGNIFYDGALTQSVINEKLTTKRDKYVFIPTSSSLTDMQKFANGVIAFKNQVESENPNGRVRLFGYPEYTRFTGDPYEKLKQMNTTFYSRFYNDPNSITTAQIRNSYIDRYGQRLPEGVPNQALYGFDVARWLIALATSPEISREAIESTQPDDNSQTTYRFRPVENGGFVNDCIYIVTLASNSHPSIITL